MVVLVGAVLYTALASGSAQPWADSTGGPGVKGRETLAKGPAQGGHRDALGAPTGNPNRDPSGCPGCPQVAVAHRDGYTRHGTGSGRDATAVSSHGSSCRGREPPGPVAQDSIEVALSEPCSLSPQAVDARAAVQPGDSESEAGAHVEAV